MLNESKMSEAEVSLRLGLYLINKGLTTGEVSIAIDGAQIQTANIIHFRILEFLKKNNCEKIDSQEGWRGLYKVNDGYMKIHSTSGIGDVVAKLKTGEVLRVESKKGPLIKSKSSEEYPLMREALGQLSTYKDYDETDILAIAVPCSPKFKELANRWREAPLIKKIGLHFLLIRRDGFVEGFDYIC